MVFVKLMKKYTALVIFISYYAWKQVLGHAFKVIIVVYIIIIMDFIKAIFISPSTHF